MSKLIEKKKARDLRFKGQSIKQIAKRLKVSPGSVSLWCRDIKLTIAQEKALKNKSFEALQRGRRKAVLLSSPSLFLSVSLCATSVVLCVVPGPYSRLRPMRWRSLSMLLMRTRTRAPSCKA